MAKEPKAAGKASVSTPLIPRAGNGPEWDALRAATTAEQLAELDYKAAQKGYAPSGRLRAAIGEKIQTLTTEG
jgi:hypothetical protein